MNSEQLFKKAEELQAQGELKQALSLLQKVLKTSSHHLSAFHQMALCYAQLGNHHEAIAILQKAISLNPDEVSLYNNLANLYKKVDRFDEAIALYERALQINPEYAPAHHNLAIIYDVRGDYQTALHHYYQALQAAPDLKIGHFNLGVFFLKNQKLEEAKTQFKNVLSLDPHHLEAHFYLGLICMEHQDLRQAEQYFCDILSFNPEHVESLANLGVIALKKNEGQKAVDYFTQALALDNQHIIARSNLAATFIHFDRYENALSHYEILRQKDPKNIEYLYNSAVAEMALGHLNEAICHYKTILSINPAHHPSLNNLAAIYIRLAKKDQAKNLLQQAVLANPEDTISQYMLNALIQGTQVDTCPEYSKNLFNNYALYYDKHLKEQLQYNLPCSIATVLHKFSFLKAKNTLDLGCGTGLTGIVLRELSQELVGVDISEKMLAQARDKQIYDELIHAELLNYLTQSHKQFDLIVAADVIPYFGKLKSLFHAIFQHMTDEGLFIFNIEIGQKKEWELQSTGRFSHHPHYISHIAEQLGFILLSAEKTVARSQNGKDVEVLLYVLQRKNTIIADKFLSSSTFDDFCHDLI